MAEPKLPYCVENKFLVYIKEGCIISDMPPPPNWNKLLAQAQKKQDRGNLAVCKNSQSDQPFHSLQGIHPGDEPGTMYSLIVSIPIYFTYN